MARTVPISTIIANARIHADQRDANFITDAECILLLNQIIPDFYDLLLSIDDNYYISEYDFPISSALGQNYTLPADFYKIVGVDFQTAPGNQRITLFPYNEAERNISFTQAEAIPSGQIVLMYVPVAPTFTATTDTFDGISGWDRLLSLRLATDMMDAEESNTDRIMKKYEQTKEAIMSSLERDIGMPGTVTDITKPSVEYLYSNVKYRLYGQNLRFISTEWIGSAAFGGPFM